MTIEQLYHVINWYNRKVAKLFERKIFGKQKVEKGIDYKGKN